MQVFLYSFISFYIVNMYIMLADSHTNFRLPQWSIGRLTVRIEARQYSTEKSFIYLYNLQYHKFLKCYHHSYKQKYWLLFCPLLLSEIYVQLLWSNNYEMVGWGAHQRIFKCAKCFISNSKMRTRLFGCERMFDKEWKINLWEITYRFSQTSSEYRSWSNKRILLQYHLRIFRWRSNSLLQYFKVTCLSNALLHMISELCNPSCSLYIRCTLTALLILLRWYVQQHCLSVSSFSISKPQSAMAISPG